jgi:hypothetical protein
MAVIGHKRPVETPAPSGQKPIYKVSQQAQLPSIWHLIDSMKLSLSRYLCPTCGDTLSRTSLYPRPELYEFQFSSYKTPLVKTIVSILIAGFGLAFVHPWLAVLAVIGIGVWYFWSYHSALRCDGCGEYFISGQFAHQGARRRPWTRADTKSHLFRWCVVSLVGGLVFLPFYFLERSLDKGCSATCAESKLMYKSNLIGLQCVCHREGEEPQMQKPLRLRNTGGAAEVR